MGSGGWGGVGGAVNSKVQQVLMLLHECQTATSRHAKRWENDLPPPRTLDTFPSTDGSAASTQQWRDANTKLTRFHQLPSLCRMIETLLTYFIGLLSHFF